MNERTTGGRALSVAFQGELGAYSQDAVYRFFGSRGVRVAPLPTLQEVFSSLLSSRRSAPDLGMVPLENSTAGSVGETFDFLASSKVRIVGETSIPVRHCLITSPLARLRDIRRVASHPQALSQCRKFLAKEGKNWQQIPAYDTAGSVKMMAESKLADTAAIASELAGEIYGMRVARKGIEDDHTNTTRFVLVEAVRRGRSAFVSKQTGRHKTSVMFLTAHEPGSLVKALSCFSAYGINLLRIESRPISGKPWEYSFYVDVDGSVEQRACREAVRALREGTLSVKVLGSYPRSV